MNVDCRAHALPIPEHGCRGRIGIDAEQAITGLRGG